MNKRWMSYLTLFASFSTLICCALPALLVSLGLGASLVSLLGAVPQLIWFSENKGIVFGVAGLMLLLGALPTLRADSSCPTDPELARMCGVIKRRMRVVYVASVVLYLIGGFFAFVAGT